MGEPGAGDRTPVDDEPDPGAGTGRGRTEGSRVSRRDVRAMFETSQTGSTVENSPSKEAGDGHLTTQPVSDDATAGDQAEPDPEPRTRRRRHVRHRTRAVEWVGLAVVAVVSVGVAETSDWAPTGVGAIDVAYRAGLVGLLVWAGSRAKRWALVVGAALIAAAGSGWTLVAGLAALSCVGLLALSERRNRLVGGAVGGIIGAASLHLGVGWLGGLTTPMAAAAGAVVLFGGYRTLAGGAQVRWRQAVLGVGAFVLVCLIATGAAGLAARGTVARALRETQAGTAAARQGDQVAATRHFDRASDAFHRAHRSLAGPWLAPATIVPGLSQNLRATRTLAAVGRDVTDLVATQVGTVDYDRLSRPEGGIDLRVLGSFRAPIGEVSHGLDQATTSLEGVRSNLLVGPVGRRLGELRERLAGNRDEADLALLAIDRGPALLGGDGQRRYLVLLGNPAEARDLGGHIGNWAELTFTDGRIDLVQVGEPADLVLGSSAASARTIEDFPPGLVDMDPRRFPQNWGSDPDLPTVARLARQLFAERTGRRVDGVAYADPRAFAAMVGIAGSRPVPGAEPPLRLSSSNAEKFLISDQYVRFPTERVANRATTDLVESVFDALTSVRLPGPRRLGQTFGPLAQQGRFAFTSFHRGDGPLIDRMGLEATIGDVGGVNLLGLVSRNANPSKIDAYLNRDTRATFRWDPRTGEVSGVVEVRLANLAPPGGLAGVVLGNGRGLPLGTNVTDLSLLTGFELQGVEVDGRSTPATPLADGRYWRHTVRVTLAPGSTSVVRFEVSGAVAPGPRHRLEIFGQPMANPAALAVVVIPAKGRLAGEPGAGVRAVAGGAVEVDASEIGHRQVRLNLE